MGEYEKQIDYTPSQPSIRWRKTIFHLAHGTPQKRPQLELEKRSYKRRCLEHPAAKHRVMDEWKTCNLNSYAEETITFLKYLP